MTRIEEIRDAIKAALSASGLSATAFPQRRHDERGWRIGNVLNGVAMTHQCQTSIPHTIQVFDDYVNAFVGMISGYQAGAGRQLVSGRLPDPAQFTPTHDVVNGFSLRFICLGDETRVDVLVG